MNRKEFNKVYNELVSSEMLDMIRINGFGEIGFVGMLVGMITSMKKFCRNKKEFTLIKKLSKKMLYERYGIKWKRDKK